MHEFSPKNSRPLKMLETDRNYLNSPQELLAVQSLKIELANNSYSLQALSACHLVVVFKY